ncbi:uncharacterized protein LOC111400868 isoform X3 [Olea europaea var. sylvestris]|uniref:uncharacterized protein LOC111400868 isoform X3 n=1 Tax=Olea europaea var. sylvestris TaxID=158386 RepID=UPI000C1D3C47|nr:uncharacterized protein LOC111400868 isoform X3 [Olea europaea var. sylvestris]
MMDLIARRYLVMVNDNDGKRVLSDAWALDTAQKTICGRGLILKVIDLMQVCFTAKRDLVMLLLGFAVKLAREAKEVAVNVYVAMRYWHPLTEEPIQQVQK